MIEYVAKQGEADVGPEYLPGTLRLWVGTAPADNADTIELIILSSFS